MDITVEAHRKKFRLYLRLYLSKLGVETGAWPVETLVLAKIGFPEQRAGHGRALLAFLVQQAPFYGYDKIAVERIHSGDNIQGFVRKFGLEPSNSNSSEPERNWIAPVSKIAAYLAK